jgi:hypothetical protein
MAVLPQSAQYKIWRLGNTGKIILGHERQSKHLSNGSIGIVVRLVQPEQSKYSRLGRYGIAVSFGHCLDLIFFRLIMFSIESLFSQMMHIVAFIPELEKKFNLNNALRFPFIHAQ